MLAAKGRILNVPTPFFVQQTMKGKFEPETVDNLHKILLGINNYLCFNLTICVLQNNTLRLYVPKQKTENNPALTVEQFTDRKV